MPDTREWDARADAPGPRKGPVSGTVRPGPVVEEADGTVQDTAPARTARARPRRSGPGTRGTPVTG